MAAVEPPLIVVVGPTASGKTALSVEIAERFGGEIICSDSRTIYRGMDVGTAKASPEDRVRVPHWGLDLVEPGERFTAADFKKYALEKIADIRSRGKIPMLVGGTGLYVDAVVFDYKFGKTNLMLRVQLESFTLEELINYCANNNIELPENEKNRRYVIRAIEQGSINRERLSEPISNTVVVGITTDKDKLRSRIERRSEQLFADGVVEEATILGKKYGWESEAMTGNVYPLVRKYLAGELDEDGLMRAFVASDWRLAKRQLTWLRRNPHIRWFSLDEAQNYLTKYLSGVIS